MENYTTTIENKQVVFTSTYIKIETFILYYTKMKNIRYKNISNRHTNEKSGFIFEYENKTLFIPCDEDEKPKLMPYFQIAVNINNHRIKQQEIEKEKVKQKETKISEEKEPIKPQEKVITNDYIVCKKCGKMFHMKGFSAHLKTHGLTKYEYDHLEDEDFKKYKFTGDVKHYNDHLLHRIKRIKDKKLGGWIESEANLNQFDSCWVGEDAIVYNKAVIKESAQVDGHAIIGGTTEVCGNSHIYGHAKIEGKAKISDNVEIYDDAHIYGNTNICNNAKIYGDAYLRDVNISGSVEIYGHCKIEKIEVFDNVKIYEYTHINNSKSSSYLQIHGDCELVNVDLKNNIVEKEKNNKIHIKNPKKLKRTKKLNYTFDMLNIPIGSILTYINDPTETCEVVDNNKINFEGEIMTLYTLAKSFFDLKFDQGTSELDYFKYDEKLLSQIYNELKK